MQGIAAFIELVAEPLYILASAQLLLRLRVVVEALSLTVKGLFTLYLLQQNHVDTLTGILTMSPTTAFSWGQIAFSSVTLIGYLGYFSIKQPHVINQLLLMPFSYFSSTNKSYYTNSNNDKERRDTMRLTGTFSFQAIEKLVLAEGTKMAAATTQTAHHQGIYGLVSNLGSLVVRTFFQPLEEAAFLAFSHNSSNSSTTTNTISRSKRKPQVPSSTTTTKEVALLKALLQTSLFLGCIGAAFAPAYSHLALLLGYSTRWANSEAPFALAAYGLLLLPLLAVNGILEAYVHAVANERELYQANMCLVGATIGHIGVCIATQQVTPALVVVRGSLGLIIADGVNMVVRILFCLWFIRRRLQRKTRELFLSNGTIVALVVSMVVTCISAAVLVPEASLFSIPTQLLLLRPVDRYRVVIQGVGFMGRVLMHVGIGVMCLVGVAIMGYRVERQALKEAWALSKEKKKKKKV
jgi:oligosaccharide translocation protein RFT1